MIYVVKNISEADRNNALNPMSKHAVKDSDTFDILKYDGYYSFDGSEDYSQPITESDFNVAIYSPLFYDWAKTADPEAYKGAHYMVRKFIVNDQKYCRDVMSGGLIVLLKMIFQASDNVRLSFYEGVLKGFVSCLSIGDIMSAKSFIESNSGEDLYNNSGNYGSIELWEIMRGQAIASINEHLQRFPR